jgi:hypothetical protein
VEGKAPDLLAEYLSKDSLAADLAEKRRRYGALGVAEYWVFNPWGEFAAPRIQGWALQGPEQFEALPAEADGSIASRVLPIRFAIRNDLLEVLDRDSREPLSLLGTLETRLQQEQEARLALEQEVERLKRQLGELG